MQWADLEVGGGVGCWNVRGRIVAAGNLGEGWWWSPVGRGIIMLLLIIFIN